MRVKFSRHTGAAQLSCLGIVIVIGLLLMGGYGVWTAYRNPTPLYISYDDYVKTKPSAAWLHLTNCTLDLPSATYKYNISDKTKVKNLTVPVLGKDTNKVVYVMLVTEDPVLMATYREMLERSQKSSEAALKWIASNPQHAYPKHDVRGLLQFNSPSRPSALNVSAGNRLAEKVYFIDATKKPDMGIHAAMLISGLVVLAIVVVRSRRAAQEE